MSQFEPILAKSTKDWLIYISNATKTMSNCRKDKKSKRMSYLKNYDCKSVLKFQSLKDYNLVTIELGHEKYYCLFQYQRV